MPRIPVFKPILAALVLILPLGLSAQWSVGLLGGTGTDHGWAAASHWGGGIVERRLSDSSSFVLRFSGQWFAPIDREYSEIVGDDVGTVAVEVVQQEAIRRYGFALEAKMPVFSSPCEGGYHRGAYVLAGLGFEHAERHIRGSAVQNTLGTEGAMVNEDTERIDRWMGRASLGAQYGTRWGSPFLEAGLTLASDPYAGEGKWLFPGQIGLQLGYRYTFRKR